MDELLQELESAGFVLTLGVGAQLGVHTPWGGAMVAPIAYLIEMNKPDIVQQLLDRQSGKVPSQVGLFDTKEGQRLRDVGMSQAVKGREDIVALARWGAAKKALEKPTRTASANDYWRYFHERGIDGDTHLGDAGGSVFMPLRHLWVNTRMSERAERPVSHSTSLAVWVYTGSEEIGPEPTIPSRLMKKTVYGFA